MNLSNKKILMLIAPKGFRDEEYFETADVLKNYQAEIITASKNVKKAESKFGKEVLVDINIYEADPKNYDALILVGGSGAHEYFEDEKIHAIARNFLKQNKLVASICNAASILAKAGLLKNRQATVYPKYREILEKNGADYIDQEVVIDNNIITANGPEASRNFAETIAKKQASP